MAAAPVVAQRWYGQRLPPRTIEYDGRFVFVRLWYADYPGWSYDWPDTEENLGRLLPQITAIDSHPGNGNILRMDDPELLKFPSRICPSRATGFRAKRKRWGSAAISTKAAS